MPKRDMMKHLRLLGLLSLSALSACTQPSFLTSFADRPPTKERLSPATASPDRWEPTPDPVDEVFPGTERLSLLPGKVGECFDTTVTAITDRYGEDLSPRAPKKGDDPGTIVRFSNSGVQVSLKRESAIVRSQLFDKVNMCLVDIPRQCPGDLRGRVYRTTNLRTKESWSLANDIKSCG